MCAWLKEKKRLRERGNVPWVNSEVKEKLFKRDALKRKAIKTNKEDDWKLCRSCRNAANAALRCAKNDYYAHKFTNKQTLNMHGEQLTIY